jgi:hypothetical protein
MDIINEVENEKFLGVFGKPFKGVFNCMTLKSGVVAIAILDAFMGLIGLINLILSVNDFDAKKHQFSYYSSIFIYLIDVISLYFVRLGIKGMLRNLPEDISMYTRYKIIEFFVLLVLDIINDLLSVSKNAILGWIGFLIIKFITGAMVKVVWSADVRIRYNQTLLVMHGEEALNVMEQQAVNLADSRAIKVGKPVYNP